jgi:hypothetical protein
MSIGLFIDGAYLYKVYPKRMDYLALRHMIEAELADAVDEGYRTTGVKSCFLASEASSLRASVPPW